MIMIRHQTIDVHHHVKLLGGLAQRVQKHTPIPIIPKNRFDPFRPGTSANSKSEL